MRWGSTGPAWSLNRKLKRRAAHRGPAPTKASRRRRRVRPKLLGDVQRDIVAQSRRAARDGWTWQKRFHLTEIVGGSAEMVAARPNESILNLRRHPSHSGTGAGRTFFCACAQGDLTNAARHFRRRQPRIRSRGTSDATTIQAHDDAGRGQRGRCRRLRMSGMRGGRVERRAAGQVQIATQPGRGFEVTALLPSAGGAADARDGQRRVKAPIGWVCCSLPTTATMIRQGYRTLLELDSGHFAVSANGRWRGSHRRLLPSAYVDGCADIDAAKDGLGCCGPGGRRQACPPR